MKDQICAIYCRLSKEDEEKQKVSESIQNQRSILLSYAAQQNWRVYDLYCDEDYSGADRSRPDFLRLLRDGEAGKFGIVLCKTQSRFTRDMELVEKYIHGKFPRWGIRFIALADHVDTEIRGNKKARQINGLINEWYLEDLSDNIRMVLDDKRRRGEYIGAKALFGYRKDPENRNRLVPDGETAPTVRNIFSWYLEEMGTQAIADRLNEQEIPSPGGKNWNRMAVSRILRNEMYLGTLVQGRRKRISYKEKTCVSVPEDRWFRVENTHEALIQPGDFALVQERLQKRRKT